jgi:serralysin
MARAVSVWKTNNQDINGLLSGVGWNTLALSYSFPNSASFYEDNYGSGEPRNNFDALNPNQITAVRQVLGMVSAATNLDFTEIAETQTAHATLRLALSDAPDPAWSYLPGTKQEGGDSWFGNNSGWFDTPVRGNYAFYAFLHEVLHALGLKHGNETGRFGAMTAAHDSMEYSVMTYRSYVGAAGQLVENETWGFAQTPMMYDIAALQHMYGADFSTNGGNTNYRWSPTTGQTFINGIGQGLPGDNRIFITVWDGGGIDTYDFSNYATGLKVDLRPGAWSLVSTGQIAELGVGHDARGNIANGLLYQGDTRSLIENAAGGSGSDVITGNAAANILRGGAGADRLNGLGGSDTLIGGSGKDVFVFNIKPSRSTNLDRITDFSVLDDTIWLENAVFTKLGAGGKLPTSAFWTGSKAHDTTDRVVYDSASGALYYDADGIGQAAPVKFGQLSKGLKMTAADFLVI